MVMMAEGAGSNIWSQPYPTSRDWKGQRKSEHNKKEKIHEKEEIFSLQRRRESKT